MGRRAAVTRGAPILVVLLLLLPLLPSAVAQDSVPIGPEPVLLRGDKVGRIAAEHASGLLLVHAGGESPTEVRIHRQGDPSVNMTEVRSARHWQVVSYPETSPRGPMRIDGVGAVWVAAVTGPVHRSERVTVGCGALDEPFLWDVSAEEIRILRDGPAAPAFVFYLPRPAPVAPDEPAVIEHTVLLGPNDPPLYLKPVALGGACEGTAVLEVGRSVDHGPLNPGLRMVLWSLAGVSALAVIAGFGVWLMARDREHHRRFFERDD